MTERVTSRHHAFAALLLAALVLAVCACAGPAPTAGRAAHEYRPGLAASPHLPSGVERAPVVVLVPGGGWVSADPSGLGGLADALAASGAVAVPVVIRAAGDGVLYPVPVEDVLCALADAADEARRAGITPTSLVVLGHSSGAHLAALAALAPDAVRPRCEDPPVVPDALVGLAGPYDLREFADPAQALLGSDPQQDPGAWAAANPVLLADRRPEVPVLLMHGSDDEVVPPAQTEGLAAALRAGGHDTTVVVVPGGDHDTIYSAEVAGRPVADWVAALDAP